MHTKKTELFLPFPPSVNSLYDGGRNTKRRFKSARYKAWSANAHALLHTQITPPQKHEGLVNAIYVFRAPDKRKRDLGNLIKAPEDFLVEAGIIQDDSLIHGFTAFWDHNVSYSKMVCFRPWTAGLCITLTDARPA